MILNGIEGRRKTKLGVNVKKAGVDELIFV